MYVCMYVWYVRDSIYLYDLFKWRPAPGLGTRSRSPPQCIAFPCSYVVWLLQPVYSGPKLIQLQHDQTMDK